MTPTIDLNEVRARRRGPKFEACKRGGFIHRKPTRTASSVTLYPLGGSKVQLHLGSPQPFPTFGVPTKEEIEATKAEEHELWKRTTEGMSFAEVMGHLVDGMQGRRAGTMLLCPTERANMAALDEWQKSHPCLAAVKASSAGGNPRITSVNRDLLARRAAGGAR